jgi:hypothetical protein
MQSVKKHTAAQHLARARQPIRRACWNCVSCRTSPATIRFSKHVDDLERTACTYVAASPPGYVRAVQVRPASPPQAVPREAARV